MIKIKKHFKVLCNIIFLVGILFICQTLTYISILFTFTLFNKNLSFDEVINASTEFMITNSSLIIIISSLLSFLIYYFVLKNHNKDLINRCNLNKLKLINIIKIILFSIGLSIVLSLLVGVLSKYFPSYKETSEMLASSSTSILGFIAIVIVAPIFEEILFRGLLFYELRKNLNIKLAIFMQAIIFGICHFNSLQTLYTTLLGILLGLIYLKTKSLYSSIISHATFNLFGSIIIPFVFSKTPNLAFIYLLIGICLSISLGISIFKSPNLSISLKKYNYFNK